MRNDVVSVPFGDRSPNSNESTSLAFTARTSWSDATALIGIDVLLRGRAESEALSLPFAVNAPGTMMAMMLPSLLWGSTASAQIEFLLFICYLKRKVPPLGVMSQS